jgi:hypothetical protein
VAPVGGLEQARQPASRLLVADGLCRHDRSSYQMLNFSITLVINHQL